MTGSAKYQLSNMDGRWAATHCPSRIHLNPSPWLYYHINSILLSFRVRAMDMDSLRSLNHF